MKEKINIESLESISLHDLLRLKDFYQSMDRSIIGAKIPEDLNWDSKREREDLIDEAIRYKLCSLDEKLFGTTVMENPMAYIEGTSYHR